ncbi:MAG TPA: TCR/Tet family MFS transporter [Vicinamibacterales bacterium]|nr:TCR/Tet family MFS transporter [Vicinamibacterales bacterium]
MGPVLERDRTTVPTDADLTGAHARRLGGGGAAFAFVFVTVLLDMIAIGIIVPVLPSLVVSFRGGDTASGAAIYGVFGTTWAAMQFIFSPVLGSLSDRFGRRTVILLSNVGLGLDYVLMAIAPSLWWLFVGRVVSGITSSSVPTAMAYIADVTEPDERAAKFGLLGVAFGVGFIVGPALGGFLGEVSLRAPFWGAAVFSLANAAYGFFILPESLPLDRRSAFRWKRANPIGAVKMLWAHPQLFSLGCASFLSMLAHDSLPTTFVLYTNYRYGWGQRSVGLVLAMVGALSIVVQGGLVGRMVGWLGERKALAVGLASGAIGMIVYGFAPTGAVFVAGITMTALYGLASPSIQSLMTRRVADTEQGQLQGAIGSMNGVANMIAPVLFTTVFAEAIGRFRDAHLVGAPFLLAAVFLAASLGVSWIVTR